MHSEKSQYEWMGWVEGSKYRLGSKGVRVGHLRTQK